MIAVVDYGLGNLGSICNMLKKIGAEHIRTSDVMEIRKSDKIILPGVGSFDNGMKKIQDLNLYPVLNEKVLVEKCPFLGICLGMQLITKSSEEGTMPGFGWIEAKTVRFKFDNTANKLKIPHMGWNEIFVERVDPLTKNLGEKPRYYFVHSYYVIPDYQKNILLTTDYGFKFASGIYEDNIYGVQFHPEKSHKFGMKMLKNFSEL